MRKIKYLIMIEVAIGLLILYVKVQFATMPTLTESGLEMVFARLFTCFGPFALGMVWLINPVLVKRKNKNHNRALVPKKLNTNLRNWDDGKKPFPTLIIVLQIVLIILTIISERIIAFAFLELMYLAFSILLWCDIVWKDEQKDRNYLFTDVKIAVKNVNLERKFGIEYGVLQRDDTNLVPVTFSGTVDYPSDPVVFDLKNEVLPYIERQKEESGRDLSPYMVKNTKFQIFVFNGQLYDDNELLELCENCLTYGHFQVSKPTFIYIITSAENAIRLKKKIDKWNWIHELDFKFVADVAEIDLRNVCADYIQNYRMGQSTEYLVESSLMKNQYPINARNYLLCSFYNNMYKLNEKETAIMAGFDYADMLLRFIMFYNLTKYSIDAESFYNSNRNKKGDFSPNLQMMGDKIYDLVSRDADNRLFSTVVKCPLALDDRFEKVLTMIKDAYDVDINTSEISLKNLSYILRIMRNKAKGHGFITKSNENDIWYMANVVFTALGHILQIYDFNLDIRKGKIYASYTGDQEEYCLDNYANVVDGFPCPLFEVTTKKDGTIIEKYINYWNGQMWSPQIID